MALAAAAVLALGLASGCGSEKKADSASGKAPLKVATNATYVPFEFKSKDGKDYTGYEIDVVRAVAKELGRDVEFKNIAFDGLIPSLQSHEVDMTASGMTATKERAGKILFAAPLLCDEACRRDPERQPDPFCRRHAGRQRSRRADGHDGRVLCPG